jgi:hypothetical protein
VLLDRGLALRRRLRSRGARRPPRERIAADPRSKVTFEIEPLGDLVKLTIIHHGFDAGSLVAPMVSEVWPRVLSGVKTLLETGETMPAIPETPGPARPRAEEAP